MQIRNSYRGINPELLYNEVRDFALKQGLVLGETRIETYSQVSDSSSFITTGTMVLKTSDESSKTDRPCCQIHIVGSAKGETKLMLDIDEKLFPPAKVAAFESDIDFIFGDRAIKP
jgi:hypothetical protein